MTHIFIVNPQAGYGGTARRLREQLEEIPDIRYYIFHTRPEQHADQLIREIMPLFEPEEKLRFYSCGGQGTICSLMNGFDDLENVEIAMYPQGLTNDFLKMIDYEARSFRDIKNLIEGEVVKVDYIKTNHGCALNTLSVGLDAVVVKKMIDYVNLSALGYKVPFALGMLFGVFVQKPLEYEYTIDGIKYKGPLTEFFFGNGHTLGDNLNFDPEASVLDGIASCVTVPPNRGVKLLPSLLKLMSKDKDKLNQCTTCIRATKFSIRRTNGEKIYVNLDGDLFEGHDYWEGEIVRGGLSLVVPKGVAVR